LTRDDLRRLLIGAIGGLDAPHAPADKGSLALNHYLSGITPAQRQQYREGALACTASDLRRWAPVFHAFAAEGQVCALAPAGRLAADTAGFDTIRDPLAARPVAGDVDGA
jgi:Zn-dependent M16 (insulinase) family peptidase